MSPSFTTAYAPSAGTSIYSTTTEPVARSGTVYPSPAFTKPSVFRSDTWGVGRQTSSQPVHDTNNGLINMSSLDHGPQSATAPLRLIPSHGKLHKRDNSASSIPSPSSPVLDNMYGFRRNDTPLITPEERVELCKSPGQSSSVKIKPYLRKLSTKDITPTLDLSRPAAENECLAGLGIHDFGLSSPPAAEVSFGHGARRNGHGRSQSVNSTYSAGSGAFKPTQPFVHPMHKTPRPYTPPSSNSFVTAPSPDEQVPDSGVSTNIMSDEEFRLRQQAFEPYRARRSTSASTSANVTSPHAGEPSISSPHLPHSTSQTNLSIKSPSVTGTLGNRPRGQTMNSFETYSASASSRASLDKAFSFMRGSKDPEVAPDPAGSRAASIHAARIAYNKKQEAKERKLLSKTQKVEQREREHSLQRRLREEKQRQKNNANERARLEKPHTAPDDRTNGKHGRKTSEINPTISQAHLLEGKEYAELGPVNNLNLPVAGTTVSEAGIHQTTREKLPMEQATLGRKSAKGRWWRFMTWLRTRLLRVGRRC